MRIGHDGRGLGTGWYLEEVVIIIHDECWIFPCNRWLADYEDDGKTERDLYAGEFYECFNDIKNRCFIGPKHSFVFTVCYHLCGFLLLPFSQHHFNLSIE